MNSLDRVLAASAMAVLSACNSNSPPDGQADVSGTTSTETTESTESTESDESTESTETSAEELSDLSITENPNNVLSVFVEWSTLTPGPSELQLECDSGHAAQYLGQSDETEHRVFVMGLIAADTCTVTAHGGGTSASLDHTVGTPGDAIPSLDVVAVDELAMEPGWTLTNLGDAGTISAQLAIYDAQGRPRWYQAMDTTSTVGVVDTRVVADGVLQAGAGNNIDPTLFDWEGNVLWSEDFSMHHTLTPDLDDPNLLYYLFDTADCPMEFDGLKSAEVRRWDMAMGTYTWSWRLCEHYMPDVVEPDWSHANSIEQFPGEDSFLVSLREQHRLVKFSGTTGDIEWTMGLGGDFAMADEDLFYKQHAPEIQANGNILLFDNGASGIRASSRGIEIAYDTDSMTAEVVWEFSPDPVIFTEVYGDADRQANGNVLLTFGDTRAQAMSNLIEVTPDGTVVWHANSPVGRKWYRAERVATNFGYVIQ